METKPLLKMRLPEEPDRPFSINIIPAIDIIFAILAFFILSSLELTHSEGLPVNLPEAVTASSQQNTRVTVTIDKNGTIFLNRIPTPLENLENAISLLLAPDETTVLINADEQTNHGRVVEVIDRLRQLDRVKIAIAVQQKP
ncbi:biopolymer transporter ExbD [Spirulina sp. 06S082]|uniref:ExbD/TolR family protein n=1 Tax=Spirulina sp. 06S082 TaxID=3110248 RepID=UPI002B200070|nr:biopolymer transporter ExbD [Spirulina sp. 06S082]MEA5468494.1 biopolymer transporter ExbD [Spirulina sp. 06S082]